MFTLCGVTVIHGLHGVAKLRKYMYHYYPPAFYGVNADKTRCLPYIIRYVWMAANTNIWRIYEDADALIKSRGPDPHAWRGSGELHIVNS